MYKGEGGRKNSSNIFSSFTNNRKRALLPQLCVRLVGPFVGRLSVALLVLLGLITGIVTLCVLCM